MKRDAGAAAAKRLGHCKVLTLAAWGPPREGQRLRTRAECQNEPRPCLWTTCRYHLGAEESHRSRPGRTRAVAVYPLKITTRAAKAAIREPVAAMAVQNAARLAECAASALDAAEASAADAMRVFASIRRWESSS